MGKVAAWISCDGLPFVDAHASMEETLAQLKPRVLSFFGLSEGTVDGGTKSYSFALDSAIQTNLDVQLGALAACLGLRKDISSIRNGEIP